MNFDHRKLGRHHLAFYRAWLQGIDLKEAADRYLETGFDLRLAKRTLDWIREAVERGAGEIVLNCMASDGVRRGYDLVQLRAARDACSVPLVASGGAGAAAHFAAVFRDAHVDAALAASVFHSGQIAIPALKAGLAAEGIEVRRE